MKKKTITFPLVLALVMPLAVGCSSESKAEKLKLNGKDVVLTVGKDSEKVSYTADDLFGELKNGNVASNAVFNSVQKAVIQAAYPVTSKIEEIVDAQMDDWRDSIREEASGQGVSYTELKSTRLGELGYEKESEYRDALVYEQQKIGQEKKFWSTASTTEAVTDYVQSKLPYHVRHLLVKLNDSASNLYDGSISSSEANKLGNVCRRLAESSFNTVAGDSSANEDYHNYTSSLGGTGLPGDLGIMDISGSVYPEFQLSTYLFDMYSNPSQTATIRQKLLDNTFINSTVNPIKAADLNYSQGFNSIDVSDCSYLANISEKDGWTKSDTKTGVALARTQDEYARNIIFNNQFNSHQIGVITVGGKVLASDSASTAKDANIIKNVSYVKGKPSANILSDGNGHPIFYVRSQSGVHFITIEKSPFEADAVQYYTTNEATYSYNGQNKVPFVYNGSETSSTIKQYVSVKQDVIQNQVKHAIKNEASGLGSVTSADEVKQIETSNAVSQIKLVQKYMSESNVTITNSTVKSIFDSYVTAQLSNSAFSLKSSTTDLWTGYNKLVARENEVNSLGLKQPMCGAYSTVNPSIKYGSCIYSLTEGVYSANDVRP